MGDKTYLLDIFKSKGIISGCTVVLEMTSAGLFFDNLKLEKQRTSLPYRTIVGNLLKQGISGYWSGLFPWGIWLGFTKGFALGASKYHFTNFYSKYNLDSKHVNIMSGFSAGAVQGACMSPLLMARIRVNEYMINRVSEDKNKFIKKSLFQDFKTSRQILNQTIQSNGIKVLLTGMPTMTFKRSLDWGTRFYFIDCIRRYISNDQIDGLTDWQKMYSAYLGGVASVSATQPVDRLIPLIQQSNRGKESLYQIMRQRFKTEGVSTFYRGWGIRSFQTGYHTFFAVFVVDKIYESLNQ